MSSYKITLRSFIHSCIHLFIYIETIELCTSSSNDIMAQIYIKASWYFKLWYFFLWSQFISLCYLTHFCPAHRLTRLIPIEYMKHWAEMAWQQPCFLTAAVHRVDIFTFNYMIVMILNFICHLLNSWTIKIT